MMSLWRPSRPGSRAAARPRALNRSTWNTSEFEPVFLFEQMLQRRVRDDAAVPEMVGADPDHRQGRRQRAAGHHVLRLDLLVAIVEIDEVAGQHVDGADRKADLALVDDGEVDELEQRLAQRRLS